MKTDHSVVKNQDKELNPTAHDEAMSRLITWINQLHDHLGTWGIAVIGLCREQGCGLPVVLDDTGLADEGGMYVYGTCHAGHEMSGPRGLLLMAIKEMFD